MARFRLSVPGVDPELLARDAAKLLPDASRRQFLRAGASLGALVFLTGCDIVDGRSAEKALRVVSGFNDRVQAWLFDPNRLAPTYPESAITRPFRFNAYYREDQAPDVDEDTYRLLIDGLVDDRRPWTLDRLYALPQETQITRLVCVEGWSAIGKWTGTKLAALLDVVQPKPEARYVVFHCADPMEEDGTMPYYESIDMEDALHPQTILAYDLNGEVLPIKNGAPLRLRVERQLGYKHAKYVMRIELVESFGNIAGGSGGYWEDQGYQWYAGI
jgi:DMSO/TMAO reductase YedYZ molybdopterin-dependent catalytic subunit